VLEPELVEPVEFAPVDPLSDEVELPPWIFPPSLPLGIKDELVLVDELADELKGMPEEEAPGIEPLSNEDPLAATNAPPSLPPGEEEEAFWPLPGAEPPFTIVASDAEPLPALPAPTLPPSLEEFVFPESTPESVPPDAAEAPLVVFVPTIPPSAPEGLGETIPIDG
jgi:hypothetical protein